MNPQSSFPHPAAIRVLMVEDNPMDAEFLHAMLRDAVAGGTPTFRVECVGTLAAAQARLQLNSLDLVLLDLSLPDSRGLDTLREMKARTRLPIVVMSGLDDENLEQDARAQGAQLFLHKQQDSADWFRKALECALTNAREMAELAARAERYQALVTASTQVLWHTDATGAVVEDLPSWRAFTGQTLEELLGFGWVDAFHLDDAPQVMTSWRACQETKSVWETDFRARGKDGKFRLFHTRGVPVLEPDGRIREWVGACDDITDRREAELSRARLTRQMEQLLEFTGEGIYGVDHAGRCTFINRAAARMLGYEPAELLGANMHAAIHHHRADGAEFPVTDCPIYHVLQTGECHHLTGDVFFRKNGNSFTVEYSSCPVKEGGRTIGAVVNFSDVTERKKLEAQLLRAQRVESIGTLASGVAHDLNNILSPILMSAPLLRYPMSEVDREIIADTIAGCARRGANIVRQLLSFGRGGGGERLVVQPAHLLKAMLGMAQETFPKSLSITSHVPSDLWTLTADPTQIDQVLLNLCVNARDAMPKGGTLNVEAENVLLDELFTGRNPGAQPGPHVLIRVGDNGTGIPPAVLERVFDPFFTTKAEGQGTGLGLSTVLGIVRSHNGIINISTAVGRGTTFSVYLPASPNADATPAPPLPAPAPAKHNEMILVVDDEDNIREMTQTILERLGYRVLAAGNGADALRLFSLHQEEITAVLTDMMMPCMGGLALTRVLRRVNPHLRIIVTSGLHQPDDAEELKALGVTDLLTKPFMIHELLEVLRGPAAAR